MEKESGIMRTNLYLLLQNIETKRQFFKYFATEYEMDKFKRKIKYSTKIIIIEDSRDNIYEYMR